MPPEYNKNVTFVEEQQLAQGRHRSTYGRPTSGMVKFLIGHGIAKNETQANVILLGIAVAAAALAIVTFWFGGGFGGGGLTPAQIRALPVPPVSAPGSAGTHPSPVDESHNGTQTPPDSFDPSLYQRSQ